MDPNGCLARLRRLVKEAQDIEYRHEKERPGLAGDMAELFDALDKWLSSGSSMPKAWGDSEHFTLVWEKKIRS